MRGNRVDFEVRLIGRRAARLPSALPASSRARSQCGASIVIALVFFLICTVIAIITLNAASTAALQRDTSYRDDEQAYQTLASAARASKDIFAYDDELSELTVSFNGTSVSSDPSNLQGQVARWVLASAKTVHAGGTPANLDVTVEADDPYTSQSLVPVMAEYQMDQAAKGSYDITVTVSYADTDAYGYALTATIASSAVSAGGELSISWSPVGDRDALGYLLQASALQSQLGLPNTSAGTQALQRAFMAYYGGSYPALSEEEAGYDQKSTAQGASAFVWKPIISKDGSVVLLACPRNSDVGSASNVIMAYWGRHYYKWTSSSGTDRYYSLISDHGFDASTLSASSWSWTYWEMVK
jgi:Tfp pilus assembly protein PilX